MTVSKEIIGELSSVEIVVMPPVEKNTGAPEVELLGKFSEISNVKTVFQTDGPMPTRHGA